MHILALIVTFISFFGIPLFLLLAIIQFFRGKPAKTLFKICMGLVPLLIIGIFVGEATTPNWYEKDQQTAAEKRENKRIQENINKNWAKAEEEHKKYEEAMHEEAVASLRTPEEMRKIAKSINYHSIEKEPNRYLGEYVKFSGTINEVRKIEGEGYIIALNVGDENLVRVRFLAPISSNKGDSITIYGTLNDLISYTKSNGDKVTAPSVSADLID